MIWSQTPSAADLWKSAARVGAGLGGLLALSLVASSATAQPASLAGMDTNRDGRTSRAEYRVGLVDGSMKFDKNADGRVTIEEMPAATRLPGIKGIMIKVFNKMDASGDGALSREELTARAEMRFSDLDTNTDGYLDAAEIKAGRRSR